jgi:F-type H+-transporting ATPase subunit a
MHEGVHVSLAAGHLTTWFGVPITNSLIMSWVVVLLIVGLSLLARKKVALIPGKFQVASETVIGGLFSFVASTLESKTLARRFTPFLLALAIFILVGNWMEFVPGVESIVVHTAPGESVPLLRGMNTDFNVPLALAIIAFLTIEVAGVMAIGLMPYIGKFINFHSPVGFFVGLLELLSEMIRLITFSFRLFGNVFAGSVLLLIITYLVPYIVPVPFMLFELFVGLIQAAVFMLLSLFFIKLAIMKPGH